MTRDEQSTLAAKADRAAEAGDLQSALRHLAEAARAGPDDPSIFLKLAGLQRATGRPEDALDSVNRALAAAPLDFTALLLRASLLDQLGLPGAGPAWGHALAQRPEGELPRQLAGVVRQAEQRAAQWTAERETRMQSAMAEAQTRADPDELDRITRFRSNALRRTRHFHSEPTEFHFPGLRELEFHPRRCFPWLEQIEAATETLTEELRIVMTAERAELVPYVQYDEHLPLEQWRPLNHSLDWTAIHLLQNGCRVEANARHCPETMKLLAGIPQPRIDGASPNAMFSLLAPGARIPPHVGVNNTRLVCHLPLIVPEGCWFRVGAQTRYWQRGEALVFDDTIEHEALNPTSDLRVVLIFDVWHPDLTQTEREAVAAMVGAEAAAAGL